MLASRYTISIQGFPKPGSNLIFHTRTQAQVVVDDPLEAALRALPSAPATTEIAKAIDALATMGFVVGSLEEDAKLLEQWCARIRADDAILRPTILTTYACNFACRYCVEEGVRDAVFMSEQTALDAAAYIAEKCGAYGSRSIALNFYGGEPLLNLPAIRASAHHLHSFARRNGIGFGFALSTNGALLTPLLIKDHPRWSPGDARPQPAIQGRQGQLRCAHRGDPGSGAAAPHPDRGESRPGERGPDPRIA
jgi:uncharacterized protein